MEMTIVSHCGKSSSSYDSRKDDGELKKNPKSSNKESMAVLTRELV